MAEPIVSVEHYDSLLAAAFILLRKAGYEDADDARFVVLGDPAPVPHPSIEGYMYLYTHPIVDDIGPGYVHVFVKEVTYRKIYVPELTTSDNG